VLAWISPLPIAMVPAFWYREGSGPASNAQPNHPFSGTGTGWYTLPHARQTLLYHRLFKTKLSLSRALVVSYTCKAGPNPLAHGYRYFIQLHTNGSPTRIFLDPFSSTLAAEDSEEDMLSGCGGLARSRDVPSLPGKVLAPLSPRNGAILHQVYTGRAEQGDTWRTR
jgi:hypothetical protein